MIGLLKLFVFGFVGLTALYLLLSVYFRSLERERLEKEWDAGGIAGSSDDHVQTGLSAYRHSLRRKLIWLVYIIPVCAILALVWTLNFE